MYYLIMFKKCLQSAIFYGAHFVCNKVYCIFVPILPNYDFASIRRR